MQAQDSTAPSAARPELSVVIPVFNEADNLDLLIARLMPVLERCVASCEVIFVDDGSSDQSLKLLLDFKSNRPDIKVVKLTRNFGAVHCSKTGMRFVEGDAFTIIAADLQDPPELIVEMVKRWLNGSKFTICERSGRQDPFMTKLFAKIYYFLIRKLVIKNYPKGGFDMALMDKVMLQPLVQSSKSVYTPLLAYWLGYRPEVIQYHRAPRAHGKSQWTFMKKLRAFLDVMLGFSVTPVRFISSIGALVAFISFGYGFSVFVHAIYNKIPVPGFATLVTLLTFLLGLIILMLGILGEYLIRIFNDTNLRPEVVIDNIW